MPCRAVWSSASCHLCRDGVLPAEGHATNGAVPGVPSTLRPSASARSKVVASPAEAAAASPSRDVPAGSSGRGASGDLRGDAAAGVAACAEGRDELDAWRPEVPIPALQRLLQQVRSSALPPRLGPW